MTEKELDTMNKAINIAKKTKNSNEKNYSASSIIHGTLKFIHTFGVLIPAWTIGGVLWPIIIVNSGNPIIDFLFNEMQ